MSRVMEKKLGFAGTAVFLYIIIRGALSKEASIQIAKTTLIKTDLKKIYSKDDKQWIIYKDSHRLMQFNRENYLILNQIYDNRPELKNQGKDI